MFIPSDVTSPLSGIPRQANQQQQIADALSVLPKLGRGLDVNLRFTQVKAGRHARTHTHTHLHTSAHSYTHTLSLSFSISLSLTHTQQLAGAASHRWISCNLAYLGEEVRCRSWAGHFSSSLAQIRRGRTNTPDRPVSASFFLISRTNTHTYMHTC